MPDHDDKTDDELCVDIANFMIEEIMGDNGVSTEYYYSREYNKPITARLIEAVKANMPVIKDFSEDDLAILANGDMEEQYDEEEPETMKQLYRQREMLAVMPNHPLLNQALEDVFNGEVGYSSEIGQDRSHRGE